MTEEEKRIVEELENLIIEAGNIEVNKPNIVGNDCIGITYKTPQEVKYDFIKILSSHISKIKGE